MITEDYVSFEIAKLLKEKGFDGQCKMKYNQEGTMLHHVPGPTNLIFTTDKKEIERHSMKNHIEYFLCPTIQMAMKWLMEVYSLYISIKPYFTEKDFLFSYTIFEKCENLILCKKYEGCIDSYEEACEAALKYSLENLI